MQNHTMIDHRDVFTTAGAVIPLQFRRRDPQSKRPWMMIKEKDSGRVIDFFMINENPDIHNLDGQVGLYEVVDTRQNPHRNQVDVLVRWVEYLPTEMKVFFRKDARTRSYATFETSPRTGKTTVTLVPADERLRALHGQFQPQYKEFSLVGAGEWTVRPVKVVWPENPLVLAVVFLHRGHKKPKA